eukprot:TRINITY_DN2100_c0_g1_i2.p2 TRINITY_DN2100_c0_g1~~TRINITY_DN2100_c0_g1_i2.p2  ORF type:complete len:108 (-),score=9.27 TRINITY_DN2100_c0_g1_i2:193-516(-)
MESVFVPAKKRGLPVGVTKHIAKLRFGQSKSHRECSVCTNIIKKDDYIHLLPCRHMFHSSCIKPWFADNTTCPNCRYDLLDHFEPPEDNCGDNRLQERRGQSSQARI